ncbi:hypothetical protein TNCV_1388831 [Trichonephila clavipes]|nr:hypothetical protein TNCV_1388831 [Trichonephila clavipes]
MGEKQQKNIIYNFPKRKVDGVKHTSKFEGQRDDNQKYYSRGYKKRAVFRSTNAGSQNFSAVTSSPSEIGSFHFPRHAACRRKAVRSPSLEESTLKVVADKLESSIRAVAHHEKCVTRTFVEC